MGIVIRTKSVIDNSYKSIRLCDSYEEIIYKIMNDSKVVFPSSYTHVEPAKQSNGQPDFIDALNSQDIFDSCYIINLLKYDVYIFTYDRKYIHISNDTYYRFHQSFNVYWQLVYYREFNEEFEVSAAGT